MSTTQLQLVFLGRLIEDDRARGAPLVDTLSGPDEDRQMVLWHDLDGPGHRRLQAMLSNPATPAFTASTHTEGSGSIEADVRTLPLFDAVSDPSVAMTPFPVLVDLEEAHAPETAPGPAASPRVLADAALATASASSAMGHRPTVEADAGASRMVVFCPNCGERQTMRVLCRGCASFLEVAMKAKAERHDQERQKARARSVLDLLRR